MMRHRTKPVHLVVDGLPAHKTALVKDYVASTKAMLTLHFLPGYAPELNPDELVWSHLKRTGVARAPLRQGEKLRDKIEAQLAAIKRTPQLIRSFFQAPTVAYITDWLVRLEVLEPKVVGKRDGRQAASEMVLQATSSVSDSTFL